MSLLIPILIPPIAQITAGVAVGLANAAQAEQSGFTLKIGGKVFTTTKPFPFNQLPFELRQDILLIALENSKSLLQSTEVQFPPGHPWSDPRDPLYEHPLNPNNPLYIGPSGERNINGYPSSSWRWLTLSREWWATLRPRLWENVILRGRVAYKGFLRTIESPDSCFVKGFIRTITIQEGFEEPFQMYSILRQLPDVEAITYEPRPPEQHLSPFGLNIIPTSPGPKALIIPRLPFDRITTSSTRAHLTKFTRLERLEVALTSLLPELATFFTTLPHLRSLILTLGSLHPSSLGPWLSHSHPARGAPVLSGQGGPASRELLAPVNEGHSSAERQHSPLSLEHLELRARTIHEDMLDLLRGTLAAEPSLAHIATIRRGRGDHEEIIYAPEAVTAAALAAADAAAQEAAGSTAGTQERSSTNHWERTTYLKLFGGVIGFRMESRK